MEDNEDYTIVNPDDVHIHVCSCGQKGTTRFMTGKEWYELFQRELSDALLLGPNIDPYDRMLDIAKKAGGVE